MTHREKVDAAVADLLDRGVKRSWAAPVGYRLLWRLGVPVRPPHYQPFLVCWFSFAAGLAGPMTLYFALLTAACRFAGGIGGEWLLLLVGGATVVASFLSAAYYAAAGRQLRLPSWDDFGTFHPGDADW